MQLITRNIGTSIMNQVIDVVWLSVNKETPSRGYWDMTLLERIFKNANHHDSVDGLTGAVVVIPGAYQGEFIDKINEELGKLSWCLVILTSDEENKFPANELKHDNMIVFSGYPNDKYDGISRWLPIGPASESRKHFQSNKIYNWSFAGQVTHPGREEFAKILRYRKDGKLIETNSFGSGLERNDYHLLLSESKVAPAPSGPVTPDTFRFYEAIEQGAVPIPYNSKFWNKLFKNPPFPIIDEYHQLNGYIDDAAKEYPRLNNRVQAWWLQEQINIENDILTYIQKMGVDVYSDQLDLITVMIPVSPIKSHPDIKILEETYNSIRKHLPRARVILTFDGVRKESEHRRDDYEEFIRRILFKCYSEWENVLPLIFDEHTHQVGMAREALKHVNTPMILYAEQDTPLTTDMEIDWLTLQRDIMRGHTNMVRFHFESHIPKDHDHMMRGMDNRTLFPLMMTVQWSQRPHLASTAFYRRILDNYFTEDAKSFIEDKMHGVLYEAYLRDGVLGWEQFKVHIYHPYGGNIKRSYHTDGRDGEEKFDDSQVF